MLLIINFDKLIHYNLIPKTGRFSRDYLLYKYMGVFLIKFQSFIIPQLITIVIYKLIYIAHITCFMASNFLLTQTLTIFS